MATYIVGDVQGFKLKFLKLLKTFKFDPSKDRLFLAGDLVNRGPDSLGTIKEIMKLGSSVSCVLGNHDVYLLALYYTPEKFDSPKHNMMDILSSPDLGDIIAFLQKCPLAIYDKSDNFFLSHAGLYPMWTVEEGVLLSNKWLDQFTYTNDKKKFLTEMFFNHPENWFDCKSDIEKMRFTLNAFTRMRYLNTFGELNFSEKGSINIPKANLIPWFRHEERIQTKTKIIFGHWSSLNISKKEQTQRNVFPTDTGVVWNGTLTALRIDDMKWFHVDD